MRRIPERLQILTVLIAVIAALCVAWSLAGLSGPSAGSTLVSNYCRLAARPDCHVSPRQVGRLARRGDLAAREAENMLRSVTRPDP